MGSGAIEWTKELADSVSTFRKSNTVGTVVLEESSTTYPPNNRFIVIRNGKVLNEDERDAFLTHEGAVYTFTVQPGDEVIFQGRERNAYSPGFEYVARSTARIDTPIPDGQYTPTGCEIETGYADFTGAAGIHDSGGADGVTLKGTPEDLTVQLYKNGTVTQQLSYNAEEFDLDDDYDFSQFNVKGFEGSLYGAGSQKLNILSRDEAGRAQYDQIAEIGDINDPVLDEYNLFTMGARVSVEAGADPVDITVGPLNYFNETDSPPDVQTKATVYRNVNVPAAFDAAGSSVLKVYRIKKSHIAVATELSEVTALSSTDTGRVEIRSVHPDWLDFGTIDETLDSNWDTPPRLRPAETSVEELQAASGDVTLLEDADGRLRGFYRGSTEFISGLNKTKSVTQIGTAEIGENVSEFFYMVVLGEVESAPGTLDRLEVSFTERM